MVQPPINLSTPPAQPSQSAAKKKKSLRDTFLVIGVLEFIYNSIPLLWGLVFLRGALIGNPVDTWQPTMQESISLTVIALITLVVNLAAIIGCSMYKRWGYLLLILMTAYVVIYPIISS